MTSQLLFIGTTELLLISGLALLLFGGKKLPEMMKGLGQGVQSFKKGIKEHRNLRIICHLCTRFEHTDAFENLQDIRKQHFDKEQR